VRVRPDGRLLVGGKLTLNQGTRALLVQLLPDGTLDPEFESLAIHWFDPYVPQPVEVLPLADGRILVAYSRWTPESTTPVDSSVYLLSADGRDRSPWLGLWAAVRLTQTREGHVMVWGREVWTESTAMFSRAFLQRRTLSGEVDRSFSLSGVTVQFDVGQTHMTRRQGTASLVECANGDFLLSGSFGWWGPPDGGPFTDSLPFLTRISPQGRRIWLSSRRHVGDLEISVHEGARGQVLYSSPVDGVVRLEADGQMSATPWKAPIVNPSASMILRDGRWLLAGRFDQVDQMARRNLVCLFDDGRVDLRFDPGDSLAGPGLNSVTGMAEQDDGRILLAGDFATFDGYQARGLVRLFPQNPGAPASTNLLVTRVERGAAECGGHFQLRLIRCGDTNQLQRVRVWTEPGTATAGVDFTPVDTVIEFPPGETFRSVMVPVLPDRQPEGLETFSVRLEPLAADMPVAGPNPIEVAIFEPNCSVSFSTNFLSVVEGAPVQSPGPGLVGIYNPSGLPVRVRSRDVTARAGADYQAVDQVILQTESIPVWTLDNDRFDGDREFELEFVDVPPGMDVGPTDRIRVVIRDNDLSIGAARGIDGSIHQIQALNDRRWFLAGAFSHVDGVAAPRMARFLPDGTLDRSFVPPAELAGRSMVSSAFPDGRVLVAGDFPAELNPQRIGVIRLRADGTVDSTFRLNLEWTPEGCDRFENWVTQIHATADGGFVAVGELPRLSRCGPTAQVVRYSASGTLLGQWELNDRVGTVQVTSSQSIFAQNGSTVVELTGFDQKSLVYGPEHPGWKGYSSGFAALGRTVWLNLGGGQLLRAIPNVSITSRISQFGFGTAVMNLQSVSVLKAVSADTLIIVGGFQTPGREDLTGEMVVTIASGGGVLHAGKIGPGFVWLTDVARNSTGEVGLAGWVRWPRLDDPAPSNWKRFTRLLQPVNDLQIERFHEGPRGFELRLRGQAPNGYRIETSDDLANWTPRVSDGGFNWNHVLLDTDPVSAGTARFYRVLDAASPASGPLPLGVTPLESEY